MYFVWHQFLVCCLSTNRQKLHVLQTMPRNNDWVFIERSMCPNYTELRKQHGDLNITIADFRSKVRTLLYTVLYPYSITSLHLQCIILLKCDMINLVYCIVLFKYRPTVTTHKQTARLQLKHHYVGLKTAYQDHLMITIAHLSKDDGCEQCPQLLLREHCCCY